MSYNSSRYAEDVDAVFRSYDFRRLFFAGCSLAGTMAVGIAASYPSPLPFPGFITFASESNYHFTYPLQDSYSSLGLPHTGVTSTVVTNLLQSILPGFTGNTNLNALQSHIDLTGTQSSKGTHVPYNLFSSWVGAALYQVLICRKMICCTPDPTRFLAEGAKC